MKNQENLTLFKRQQKLYTYEAAQSVIDQYMEKGCDVYQVDDGCCGIGDWICDGGGVYKSCVIKEVPLTCWTSAQKIRFYNKLPQKYEQEVQRWWDRLEEEERQAC